MRKFVLAALIAFVWSADEAAAGPEDYLGAERCGACHVKELTEWKASPHATALARLSEVQQRNAACRSCHTMAPTSKDPSLLGVQCESCHGPGRMYAPEYVMKDKKLSALVGLKKINEATCKSCHRGENPNLKPFDYATLIQRVNHGAGTSK